MKKLFKKIARIIKKVGTISPGLANMVNMGKNTKIVKTNRILFLLIFVHYF
jgi:hypothetical protein